MKKAFLFLLFAILFFSFCVHAQEKGVFAEQLSWLPQGSYQSIENSDLWLDKADSKGHQQFQAIMGKRIKQKSKSLPLPQSFIPRLQEFTLARLASYSSMTEEELEEFEKPENRVGSETKLSPITIAFRTEEGKRVFSKLHHQVSYLWIFAFEDVQGLILNERKKGILSPEKKKYRKQEIFSFTARSGGLFYASATHTDLFLVCRDRTKLQAMIRAGLGEEGNVLDSPEYEDIGEALADMGSCWMISDLSFRTRIQLEEELKLGAPRSRLEYLEKLLHKLAKVKYTYWVFGDILISKEVMVYLDEDAAKSAYESATGDLQKQTGRASSMKGERGEYAKAVFGNMKYDLQGNRLIRSRFMGEEYLKISRADSLRTEKEEARRKKAKKKK